MKPVEYSKLPSHSLFQIFAERKAFYENGERKVGFIRSHDRRVYKKYGNSHASTKEGKTIILALNDLVMPFVPKTRSAS